MAAPSDDIFAQLQNKPCAAEVERQEREYATRVQAQETKTEQRQSELIGLNATKPVTISSVRVLNALHTRRGFLERVFDPLLRSNKREEFTLQEALGEIGSAVDKLDRFGIFKSPISTYIDQPDATDPSSTVTDLSVFIAAQERGKYTIKTGTEAGSAEGSAYLNAVLRNLFGGAESLNVNASLGTRTRSAYSAFFDTPILSNPDLRWEIGGLASSTLKSWASHEEVLRGGSTRLRWAGRGQHELSYSGLWRQITSLADKASATVRADAGDSFKSSIAHTWVHDRRDAPMLPTRGFLFKTVSELAGFGPLGGDVAFGKFQFDSQAALPVPLPGLVKGDSGITFTAGLRGGVLCPLSRGGAVMHSRINDRFQLGGPTDVRSFRLSGLGPRDGIDSVGGDVFAAGGASLLLPVPRVGKDTPLRFQAFINGGRLLALKETRSNAHGSGGKTSQAQASTHSVVETVKELGNGLPSCAVGLGLVYAHPVARFELNLSVPLVVRRGEEGRKGVSFGVGIDFL